MDSITETAIEKRDRAVSAAKLKSMETWENIQALAGNLMAAEDFSVVFDANIKAPAHIDLQRRIVRVAQLDPSQKHLIPGLVFHETCHALWTKGNEPIDIVLNMIEDGYIERMGCKKFPGGKKHLRVIFDEFFDAKKVQKQGRSLVTRTLNTLNYNCKGIKFGKTLPYPEDLPEEIAKFLREKVELTTLPTLKERDALAKTVKKLLKPFRKDEPMDDIPEDIRNLMQPSPGQGQGGEGEEGDADPTIDWGDEDEKKPRKGQGDGDDMNDPMNQPDEDKKSKDGDKGDKGDKGDEGDESDEKGEGEGGAGEKGEETDQGGKTQKGQSGIGEDGGVEDEDGAAEKGSTPSKKAGSTDALPKKDIDPSTLGGADDDTWLDDHLEDKDNGEVFDHHGQFDTVGSKNKRFQLEVASPEAVLDSANVSDINDIAEPHLDALEKKKINRIYSKALTKSKKVARLMYQRFLLTKNAHDAQRVSYRRSGQLDISRLPYYKTHDDLFMTRRILPKGENHAIAVMLDWSGSMGHQTIDLWERTAEYVEFSRLAGVDVVVYTFTTGHWNQRDYQNSSSSKLHKYGAMAINHGNFIRLVDTTRRSAMETQSDLRKFWYLANIMGGRGSRGARGILSRTMSSLEHTYGMGGTNIVEGHSFGVAIAKKLRKNAEKVSVIVVADGGDSNSWSSTVGGDESLVTPDDDGNLVKVEDYRHEIVLHGKPLPKIPAHLEKVSKSAQNGYWYASNHLGERQRALLGQVQTVKELGITTVGIYLGSIEKAIYPLQAMPYEGNLIEWTDLGEGNSFIGILIRQIS